MATNGPWDMDWEDGKAGPKSPSTGKDADPWSLDWGSSAPKAPDAPSALRRLADAPVALAKGVVGAGEAAVGIADLATGGRAGKFLNETTGYDPKATKAFLDEQYSPQQKAAKAEVDKATGFTGKAAAMLENPSTIGEAVAESAPLMLGGGAVAQGLGRATTLGVVARSALGEGIVGAGSAAEGIRQETPDGTLGAKQTAAAIGTGAGTAAITALSGGVARKLGISDLDTQLATRGGVAEGLANTSAKGRARRLAEGAVTEGVLEEMPQSGLEQGLQNVALDKPIGEGVPEAMAAGMLTGMAMGGPLAAAPATAKGAQPADPAATQDSPTLALPAPPPSTGTPNAQVMQSDAERATQVAQAEARAADIYRQRDEFDAARQANLADAPLPFDPSPAEELAAQRKAAMGIDPAAGPLSAGAAIAVETQAAEEVRLGAATMLAEGAARAQQAQAERAAWEAANPGIPYEPVQPARQESRPAHAARQQPTGSFGAMNDFADLLDQERQDVSQRRAGIAERQGQRREFDLAEADRRTAESMQREAQARRRAVLDAVLADPETKNPTGRFAATLRREGYRDSTPTEDELRTIQRFEDVRAAKPAPPEVEPSAPNELDPAAVGIRERRAPAPPKNLREGMARAQAARAAEGGSMPQAAQPTAAPSFDPGKAWSSLDTKQRADLAGRLQGVPQIVSKNVPRAEWEKINPALRGKLAEAMAPRAAAPIEGADLGDGWAKFSAESGTAGVPRAEMPQIKAEHRGAMVNFMNARGVSHTAEEVSADSLRPTQAEFSPEKVRRAAGFKGGDRSILVSADNYVLDGHHQWLASRESGEPVKVIRLNAPIADLIPLAREFPSSTLSKGSKDGQTADPQDNARLAAQGGAQGRADVDGGAGDLVQRSDGAAGAGMGAASAGPVRGGAPVEPAGTAGGRRGAVGQAAPFRPKNLAQLVREAGGVSIDRKADINQDSRTVGVFRKGGMDLDGLAELLQQNGFMTDADVTDTTSGAERAAELLRAALAGERVLSMNDIDEAMGRDAEAQYREEIRRKAAEYGIRTTFRPFGDVEREVLARDGELAPEDRSEFEYGGDVAYTLEPLDDIDLQDARTISEEDQMRMAGFSEDEINETINGTGFRESQGAPEQAQSGTAQESRDAGAQEDQSQEGSSEGLTSYTNEDIARQEAAQRAAAAEAERNQREADQKAQADAERDTFALTGSDRAADVLAAQGQGGLFDKPAAVNQEPIKNETRASAGPAPAERASDQEPIKNPAPAVGNAPSPLEALFSDLNSDSTRKANKAKKAAAKLPEAARIEYVQANFHDILMQMMEAGALEVNGFATLTEDNAPCL